MDIEEGNISVENRRNVEEMYQNLTNVSKQLSLIQAFMESKFGVEFTDFCQFSEGCVSINQQISISKSDSGSVQDDGDEYDKMPNLVSQESPSRTLGYVTVPLRQSTQKLPSASCGSGSGISKRERSSSSMTKEDIHAGNDNDDMMYQLHNFPDLLVENSEEMETNETPEFLELELDPSALLRGEPPALHPMFADINGKDDVQSESYKNSSNHSNNKRCDSRQNSSILNAELENVARSSNTPRRASIGGHESHTSQKKFDCLICGIKFEYAETLKSHMDSHTGSRNIRSNSEEQSGLVNTNAPPLPKLMPRPIIPSSIPTPELPAVELPAEVVSVKRHRTKKVPVPSISSSASSSASSSFSKSTLKRRKRLTCRPCSLVCPECGLKIRDKSRLIEHVRGHTGERPFQCSYCDRSYTRKDVLKTHVLKMHGDVDVPQ